MDPWDDMDVYRSQIKEPDFEILKSFDDVNKNSQPVGIATESPKYNVNRSQLPALSIFDSSSSRSSSAYDSRVTSEAKVEPQPISGQVKQAASSDQPVTTAVTASSANQAADTYLPALSIFDSKSSTSHRSKEEKSSSVPQQREPTPRSQPPSPKPSRGAEQKTTSSPRMSPRPTRVITGRQGVSNQNGEVPFSVTEEEPPSGRTIVSSIEPFHSLERKRILDFEDLYTARQEGQMVGIGAKSKVSTFASPASNQPKKNEWCK